MPFVSNARMYAVSPEAETAWKELIAHVAEDAGTAFDYVAYPAPRPLEDLWRRDDLGCVQMCGYPIALDLADVVPLASPIPAASWAGGKALSRTDLIVRVDAPFRTLSDTFGDRGLDGRTLAVGLQCAALSSSALSQRGPPAPLPPFGRPSRHSPADPRQRGGQAVSTSGRWTPTGTCWSGSTCRGLQRRSAYSNRPKPYRCRHSSPSPRCPGTRSITCARLLRQPIRGPGSPRSEHRF